jgi:hypothetical protein
MKSVYSAANISLVSIFQHILEERGITCWIKNEFLWAGIGEIPPIECWPQLCVGDNNYSEAQRIVDEALSAKDVTSAWKCNSCGEDVDGQFSECWNCGKSCPEPDNDIYYNLKDIHLTNDILKTADGKSYFIQWYRSAGYKNTIKILVGIFALLIVAGAIKFSVIFLKENALDKENKLGLLIKCTCTSGDCNNGQGSYIFANGGKYVGEFKNGHLNGQGTLTFASGSKYVGEFKNGHLNGQGTLTFASGSKYVGEFNDDHTNGQGIYTWANGDKYVGEFKDGHRNGQGTYTWANGDKYVGEFKDGHRNGQGTLTYTNGNKYVGEFKDGNIHGQGTMSNSDGTKTQKGRWEYNKYVGE